jgi:hypothetical protein
VRFDPSDSSVTVPCRWKPVSHLRRLKFLLRWLPALPRWANLCRAYGAGAEWTDAPPFEPVPRSETGSQDELLRSAGAIHKVNGEDNGARLTSRETAS